MCSDRPLCDHWQRIHVIYAVYVLSKLISCLKSKDARISLNELVVDEDILRGRLKSSRI